MTQSKLNIQGFKCFNNESFTLNDVTVLCGSNGSGKSSIIQSILLTRLAIEKNASVDGRHYNLAKWIERPIPLNGYYELALGVLNDIENDYPYKVEIDDHIFEMLDSSDEEHTKDSIIVSCKPGITDNFIISKEFYYLNAERLGPRYISDYISEDYISCGHRGENTARAYRESEQKRIDKEKLHLPDQFNNFQVQFDAWLDYICPGIKILVGDRGALNGQIRLHNGRLGKTSVATNIGFGISYLLPIIITGLIAERGSLFIVENPEAHLHPKAQSNLGYFLGQISAAGIKILIETHSEHIVNGIRKAALTTNTTIK